MLTTKQFTNYDNLFKGLDEHSKLCLFVSLQKADFFNLFTLQEQTELLTTTHEKRIEMIADRVKEAHFNEFSEEDLQNVDRAEEGFRRTAQFWLEASHALRLAKKMRLAELENEKK